MCHYDNVIITLPNICYASGVSETSLNVSHLIQQMPDFYDMFYYFLHFSDKDTKAFRRYESDDDWQAILSMQAACL